MTKQQFIEWLFDQCLTWY